MKTLFYGVKMNKTVLLKTIAKHGRHPSNPIGEEFDPNFSNLPGHQGTVVVVMSTDDESNNCMDQPLRGLLS
ncbi:hypothetical protein PENTCL1PPCAC_13619, partial [Pristionchus entomophagus]